MKKISEQYKADAKTIWDNWSVSQRTHFLKDHEVEINRIHKAELGNNNTKLNTQNYATSIYFNLEPAIRVALEDHVATGKYAKGATIDKDGLKKAEYKKQMNHHETMAASYLPGDKDWAKHKKFHKDEYEKYKKLYTEVGGTRFEQGATVNKQSHGINAKSTYTTSQEDLNRTLEKLKEIGVYGEQDYLNQEADGISEDGYNDAGLFSKSKAMQLAKQFNGTAEGDPSGKYLVLLSSESFKKEEPKIWYQVEYYDNQGGHGALNGSSSNFQEEYIKAVDLYKREKKAGELGKSTGYIGVNGSGDKFAIVYMDQAYFDNLSENDFKDKVAYENYMKVAKKVLKSGKPLSGSYGEKFADGGGVERKIEVSPEGANGYICFYKGKQMEVHANTSLEARNKAAVAFKATKKPWEVTAVLAEKGGEQVTHVAAHEEGATIIPEYKLEETARYMQAQVKKGADLKDLMVYFEKENNLDYKVRAKIWDEMNVWEMPKTYDNILKVLKAVVKGNEKFEQGGNITGEEWIGKQVEFNGKRYVVKKLGKDGIYELKTTQGGFFGGSEMLVTKEELKTRFKLISTFEDGGGVESKVLRDYISAENEIPEKTIDSAVKLISEFLSKTPKGKIIFNKYIKGNVQKHNGKIDWYATLNDTLQDEEFQEELSNSMGVDKFEQGATINKELDFKAQRFLKAIRISDNKISLEDVTVDSSPKGNWIVYHKGKKLMTVNRNLLDEETIQKYELEHREMFEQGATIESETFGKDKIGEGYRMKGKPLFGKYPVYVIKKYKPDYNTYNLENGNSTKIVTTWELDKDWDYVDKFEEGGTLQEMNDEIIEELIQERSNLLKQLSPKEDTEDYTNSIQQKISSINKQIQELDAEESEEEVLEEDVIDETHWSNELIEEESALLASAINRYGTHDHPEINEGNWKRLKLGYIKEVMYNPEFENNLSKKGETVRTNILRKLNKHFVHLQ